MQLVTGGSLTVLKGTANTTVARLDIKNPLTGKRSFAKVFTVRNLGDTNALRVYLPKPTNAAETDYVTILPNSKEDIVGPVHYLGVAAAASTTAYEILASVA